MAGNRQYAHAIMRRFNTHNHYIHTNIDEYLYFSLTNRISKYTFNSMECTLIFAITTMGPRSLSRSHYADVLGLLEYIGIHIGLS